MKKKRKIRSDKGIKKGRYKTDDEKKSYKCDKCCFITNHKNNFNIHYGINHMCYEKRKEIFNFNCDFCKYSTKSKTSFGKHLSTKRHLRNIKFFI